METTPTKRGLAIVPAPIRKRHDLHQGDLWVWLDDGQTIRALRGLGSGEGLVEKLLE